MKRILSTILCLSLLTVATPTQVFATEIDNEIIVSDENSDFESCDSYDNTEPASDNTEETENSINDSKEDDNDLSEELENILSDTIYSEDEIVIDEVDENIMPYNDRDYMLGAPVCAEEIDNENWISKNNALSHNMVDLTAPAENTGIGVDTRTPDQIEAYFDEHPATIGDSVSFSTKPVVSGTLNPGALSEQTLNSALNMMNRVRFVAGLNDVSLNSIYNERAQAGMLVDYMLNQLTHYPSQPAGMSDEMYKLGEKGTSHSNIAWASNPSYTLNQSIVSLWMGDSDSYNIDRLGHRRWMLDPRMQETGFGAVSGNKGIYSAVYSMDGFYKLYDMDDEVHRTTPVDSRVGVAWPAQIMPTGYFAPSDAWSYSAGKEVDMDTATVVLTRKKDGKKWTFTNGHSDGFFNVENSSYGQPGCIIFRPNSISAYNDGDIYDVSITYAQTGKSPVKINYSVSFFKPNTFTKVNYVLGDTVDYPATNNENNPTKLRAIDSEVQLYDPARFGYEFEGWYKEATYKNRITKIPAATAASITIYAKWKKIPITLASGKLSSGPSWTFVDDGSLIFEGSGDINFDICPWEAYKDKILEIKVPSGVTSIDAKTFADCNNLTAITFENNTNLICDEGIIYSSDKTKIYAITPLYSNDFVMLSKEVVWISANAFLGCAKVSKAYCYTDSIKAIVEAAGIDCVKITIPSVEAPVITVEENGAQILGTQISKDTYISLASTTKNVSIFYTTDGSEPVVPEILEDGNFNDPIAPTKLFTEDIYTSNLDINPDTAVPGVNFGTIQIQAIAARYGYKNSAKTSITYTVIDDSDNYGEINESDKTVFPISETSHNALWVSGVTDMYYTGVPVTLPNLTVYKYKTKLVPNIDYTVRYSNNKNAGTAKVIITGKGNYAGTIVKTFEINKVDISSANAADIVLAYNKRVQKGTTTVTCTVDGVTNTLKANTDFKYVYPKTDNKVADYDANAFNAPGEYEVTITGNGNYEGTTTFTEKITEKKLISKMTVKGLVAKMPYNDGAAVTQEKLEVWDGKTLLEKDNDYTVEYKNNTEIGKATITITGKGDYIGTKTVTFDITGTSISKMAVDFDKDWSYVGLADEADEGNQIKPVVRVYQKKTAKTEEMDLTEDDDYIVTYENNVNAGSKATIVITGINGYTGTVKKTFTIKPKDLTTFDVEIAEAVYQKSGSKPEVTVKDDEKILKPGVDYTVAYSNNTKVHDGNIADAKAPTVKITGKGNYKGILSKKYPIAPSDIANVTVAASDIVYQNKAGICKPKLIVTDTDGKALTAGTDYDKNITYRYKDYTEVRQTIGKTSTKIVPRAKDSAVNQLDIIPVGTEIIATIIGKGNYTGTVPKEITFRFVKNDLSKASVSVNTMNYTGKAIRPGQSDIIVKVNGNPISNKDYRIVSYANNLAKGKGKITIEGVGSYGGQKEATFNIVATSMNYNIIYLANYPGATNTMKNSVTAIGSKISSNSYKRPGYIFLGWSYDPDDSEVKLKNSEVLTENNVKGNGKVYGTTLTLYAQWKAL